MEKFRSIFLKRMIWIKHPRLTLQWCGTLKLSKKAESVRHHYLIFHNKMESSNNQHVIIRPGHQTDCVTIIKLVKEFAETEICVNITAEDLLRDAFVATPPIIYTLVAELSSSGTGKSDEEFESESGNKKIIGCALYYKTYSAWKGKALHLENLVIKGEYKNKIEEKFLQHLAEIAFTGNYAKLSLECVISNKSTISFYTNCGARNVTIKDHWDSYRFNKDAMRKLMSD